MLPFKKWKILNHKTDKSVIDVILENRNLLPEHLEDFRLSERLHDPLKMKDMARGVDRVLSAIKNRESILIYGDYDVDGVVSTVLMVKLFEKIGYPVEYAIPDRKRDGYGLKPPAVERAIEKKYNLIITVDNGISSGEAVDLANKSGIDVVITDHHLQEGELPAAWAVINPNRKDCKYPFKGICGAGVVFKFLQAIGPELLGEGEYKNFLLSQLDLLAMAIVTDIVPVRDENYALLKFGLISLNKTLRPGIVELKRISGLLGKEISTVSVGFYLGPRLNAAGRMASADLSARLLLSDNREEAAELAATLDGLNRKRQKLQEDYLVDALEELSSQDLDDNYIHLVKNDTWEPGIIGIIAGKLKDRFNRPVIALAVDDAGNWVGSARSIEQLHITDMLSRFSDLFVNFGGHAKAAGLTISKENFERFRDGLTAYVNKKLNETDLRPNLVIDSIVRSDQINKSVVDAIDKSGPFGEENPEPVLLLRGTKLLDIIVMGQGKHLKLKVESSGRTFECVWWNRQEVKDIIRFNSLMDIVFKPKINIWNGVERIQLVVEDMAWSE